jgi:hydroxymethylglutaryl-CoA lyase
MTGLVPVIHAFPGHPKTEPSPMQNGNGTKIHINEVATRDGFQMESLFVPTQDKIALIDTLSTLGFAKIEVSSFTSPKAIPTLRDAADVMEGITRNQNVIYTALIPNIRGAERAIACGVAEFNLVMSVSETHNLCNLRMTREQSFAQLTDVIALAQDAAVPVNVSLSTSFGCPMEGEVPADEVLRWIDRFATRGIQGVTLCDTTGMAHPLQAQSLCDRSIASFPSLDFTAHFHNTRGMGLANVVAAIEAGIRRLDSALGGIGGCPYAPGATGNVATEDVAHMLDCLGYDTGLNLNGLISAAARLRELVDHTLPAQVSAAGPRLRQYKVPADFEAIKARAHTRAQAVA